MSEPAPPVLPRQTFGGLLTGRRQRRYQGAVTALEVDGGVLHVVSAANRGTITRLAAEPLDLPAEADRADAEVMGKAIARALQRLRFKPGAVVAGVPRASVLLRTLSLPLAGDLAEVAAVVHLQVSKDLPYRTDEAVIDFKVREVGAPPPEPPQPGAAPAAPARKIEVMVAVVKREVVEFHLKMAAAAGFKLVALGLLSQANARCLEACRTAEDGKGIAIITLRSDEVGIDVVAQGSLLFSRGASLRQASEPVGTLLDLAVAPPAGPAGTGGVECPDMAAPPAPAGAPGPAGSFVEEVTIEVVRSLHGYGGMEAQHPVTKIVVVGTTGQEQAVVEALQARLNIPCGVLDAAAALHLPAAEAGPQACSMSAIGLALGASEEAGLPFDFLHPKKPAPPRDLRKLRVVLGVVAAVALLIFFFGLRSYMVTQRLKLKTRVGQELIEARKKRPVYAQMRQQLAAIQDWSQGGHNWLEHYAYLSAVLPPSEEVYVTSLSISGSGAIRLSVQARSGQILAKLDKQLRAAGYDVKPLAINPGDEKNGYGFRSTVELEVPPKMKLDLSKAHPPQRPADDASLEGARKGGAP
jgi:Tfp pilus assembly PilM family ATPase